MKNYLLSSIVVAGSLLVATQAYAASGKDVYEASCVACHASGAAGAPKLEDKAAWAPRLKTGAATLHTSALKGKGAMPAKGGNAALSDADVTAAVDFMMSKAK
jgi:cytochrome c5